LKHTKAGDIIKRILFVELVLIFSLASSFLISAILINEKEDLDLSGNDQKHLFQNLRVLKYFRNLELTSPPKEPGEQPDRSAIENSLVRDILVIKEADLGVQEGEFDKIPLLLEELSNRYGFLKPRQRLIFLRYLYAKKKYSSFIKEFETNSPPSNLEVKLMYINSLLKLNRVKTATTLFKELFKTRNLKEFKKKIPSKHLTAFLQSLTYQEWFQKFRFLIETNRYSEFRLEKKYARTPQLIDLTYAEFYYRRKQYSRAKRVLKNVTAQELKNQKNKILAKIELRKEGPEKIQERLEALKEDKEVYPELLMDVASILLVKGDAALSSLVFTKFIELDRPRDESFYKAAWVTAWLHFRQGETKKAMQLFEIGSHAPGESYRAANLFWLSRMNGKESKEIENYPFSYYYVKSMQNRRELQAKSSRNFSPLINGPRSPLFNHIINDLKALLANNMLNDGIAFIKSASYSESLTQYDRNMLKIIQSILYLKKRDFFRAFISFRNNFDCYTCIIPPGMLNQVYAPSRYEELIMKYSRMRELDPFLVMALIREETMFNAGAVSPARALGLMQLLLRTARQMAGEEGIKNRIYRRHLFDPELNIKLGTRYLKFLLNKYRGQEHLALAAYNAGDHRVDNWLKQFGDAETEEFIEMIPFTATRNYVKNIIRNRYYYRYYYD